ncbi:hypothetical protein [Streptomyces niger]|uniref:hypothetical protein n=1 Tax=Streptomyces niger TaxID=66373 RepID=UPI00069AE657|nr:hypothetical protein [Streptomyces niger]
MRNDFSAQVETREIADSDLDGIAGGTAALAAGLEAHVDVTVGGSAVQAVEGVTQGALAKADGLTAALPTGV